jgi:hypothetical protein
MPDAHPPTRVTPDAHLPPRVMLDAHPPPHRCRTCICLPEQRRMSLRLPERRRMRIRLPVATGRTSTSPVATERASASQTNADRANTPPRCHPPRACVRKPRSSCCIPLREGTDLRVSIVVGSGARAPSDSPGPACSTALGSGRQGSFGQAAAETEGILISCSCLY